MKTTFRLFDYHGTAVARPDLNKSNPEQILRDDRTIKRVEVFQRQDNETVWDEKRIAVYYSNDFK